jgi:protocatechuate 3,4-dioxygenase beta subunit
MTTTRRNVLEKCLALGGLTVASSLSPSAALEAWAAETLRPRRATPINELGPFYKRMAPANAVLRAAGDPGTPLTVTGEVWGARGASLPGAVIEIWQADHNGHYDIEGYRYRARFPAGSDAQYKLETTMPGHYPSRVCQHIHFLVTAPGHKPLITQLYFATDPRFEGDPDRNYTRDPLVRSRELVRPVELTGAEKDVRAAVTFELVLEAL